MGRIHRWTILGVLWVIIVLNFGFTAYAPAVVNAAMAKSLGLSHESLGDIFAVYMLLSGLPGPVVAFSIYRLGARGTLALGSLLIMCGALLMATVVTGTQGALLCFGALVGAGNITGSLLPAQSILARWFLRRRSTALAVLYSGGAVGGIIAAPLVSHLIEVSGTWRAGWWVIAAGSSVAGCLALLFVRERPRNAVTHEPDSNAHASRPASSAAPPFVSRHEWTYRQAVSRPTYWLMLCAFLGASSGNTVFLAQGVTHLQGMGHSASFAAWAVGIMTASGLAGKATLAALGERYDPRLLLAGFLALYGVGLALFCTADTGWQALLSVTCLGIGFGGGYVSLMTVVSNYYGTSAFPALAGTMTAIPTAFSAAVSSVAGRLVDMGAGYSVTFYVLATWCLAGTATLLLLRPPSLGAVPSDYSST